ncbi:hypothetical protein Bca4012_001367 [Brassica carinata]
MVLLCVKIGFLKQSGLKIKRGFEKFNGIQFRINVIWQRWLATSFGPSPKEEDEDEDVE